MTLLVLALVGLMVLVVTVSPPQQSTRDNAKTAPSPAPSGDSQSGPDLFDVTATLSAAGGKPKTVEAVLGDRVEIVVQGREPGSVALGELHTEEFERNLPARFELLAETPGTYPLVVLDGDRRIGTLEIR